MDQNLTLCILVTAQIISLLHRAYFITSIIVLFPLFGYNTNKEEVYSDVTRDQSITRCTYEYPKRLGV